MPIDAIAVSLAVIAMFAVFGITLAVIDRSTTRALRAGAASMTARPDKMPLPHIERLAA